MNLPPESPAVKVSVYLSTAQQGGELVFPDVPNKTWSDLTSCETDLTQCCSGNGSRISLQGGDAVLIYGKGQDGALDRRARHGHCPISGGKLFAVEWHFKFNQKSWRDEKVDTSKKRDNRPQPSAVFENLLDRSTWLFWVPPHGGDEVPMGEVLPGDTNKLSTHSGHVFHARDENG